MSKVPQQRKKGENHWKLTLLLHYWFLSTTKEWYLRCFYHWRFGHSTCSSLFCYLLLLLQCLLGLFDLHLSSRFVESTAFCYLGSFPFCGCFGLDWIWRCKRQMVSFLANDMTFHLINTCNSWFKSTHISNCLFFKWKNGDNRFWLRLGFRFDCGRFRCGCCTSE